ncbi:hypothetical protein [Methanosarcina lacustris]|nr:hypothetical protein [Methanosarcina lacustris]
MKLEAKFTINGRDPMEKILLLEPGLKVVRAREEACLLWIIDELGEF